jgi:hypothetical protein
MTATALGTQRSSAQPARDVGVVLTATIVAIAVGAVTARVGPIVPVALAALTLFVLLARRPVLAAYLYVAALPFVTGMERGSVLPFLRPNEAVQVFVTAAVLAGAGARFIARSSSPRVRITRLDRAIFLLAIFGSVWPLVWLLGRGQDPTTDDLLSSLVLWRFFALYVLLRYAVRTPRQMRQLLWVLLAGACALAALALLQGLGLAPVSRAGRGESTLSSSIAVGDYVAYSLALVLALYLRDRAPRRLLSVISVVLVVGSLATGQFSAWIAALIVVLVMAAYERQLVRLAVRLVPVAALALLVAWPIVDQRLAGFGEDAGVPSSWLGRVDNLSHFYLPQLGGFQWVLGVRPNSVIPAPETWRDVIWLESGLLWLLWVGGVPLLIAFLWFLRAAFAHVHAIAGSRSDDLGAVALAAWASLWAMAILTVIDMHLTLRGGGDVLFILLGLSAVTWCAPRSPAARSRGSPPPPLNEERSP